MSWCHNEKCPHFELVGRQAEYNDEIEKCPECEEPLSCKQPADLGTRQKKITPEVTKKLFVTVLLVLFPYLGYLVYIPGIDLDELQALGPFSLNQGSLIALGVLPILSGFMLVELGALAVGRWRKKRLADPSFRKKLVKWSYSVGGLVAIVQGVGIANWLESLSLTVVICPGWFFRLQTGVVLALGSGLFAISAQLIERFGIGRGFAVVMLVGFLAPLPEFMIQAYFFFQQQVLSGISLIVIVLVPFGFIYLMHLVFKQADKIIAANKFRFPTCGTQPLELGTYILFLMVSVSYYTSVKWIYDFTPGSLLYYVFLGFISLVFTVPFSIWFYWRHRQKIKSVSGNVWSKTVLASGIFVAALVGVDFIFSVGKVIPSDFWPGALYLVVVYALCEDWHREFSAHRNAEGKLEEIEIHQDLTDALTRAAELAQENTWRNILVSSVRFRSLSYFFGPFIPLVILGERIDSGES
jgi:preprotein translocase subunit SecY